MTKRKCSFCNGTGYLTKTRAEIYAHKYAKAVKLRRANRVKWTHEAIATHLGVSRSQVQKWIKGI